MKKCTKCKEIKALSAFKAAKKKTDGLSSWCKKCSAKQTNDRYKEVHSKDPSYKEKAWETKLKQLYKISKEDYNKLLKKQNNVCAICEKTNKDNRRLAVDHCHETGKVRGLLCDRCNRGIGMFDEDPGIIHGACIYLNYWNLN